MHRFGNFSSSSIHKLCEGEKGFIKSGLTYIREVYYEKELGRQLGNEANSKETNWGNLCEPIAFDLLGLEYKLVSKDRLSHSTIDNWNGMPDNTRIEGSKKIVGDTKCPFTLKSFISQIKAHEKGVKAYKEEFPEYYWQLVSNAILTNSTHIEAIIYVPYKSEIEKIRQIASSNSDYRFIEYMYDNQLPYLLDGGKYKNINTFVYELPIEDISFLEKRVKMANVELEKLLNETND
jgi:hypothetical protein